MEKLKKPFLFFLALLLMMGLIGFTTHVFADDEDTEIQTSTEVTGTAEENVDVDDSPADDSQISDESELTENTNSSESNEMGKMPQTDSTEELENTEELYAMDSDTNENEIATIAEKRNLFIDPNGGTYGGNSGVTTVDSEYGASYELNEIPVRDGYTFAGWSRSGSGSLHSGNSTSRSGNITQTEKADSDGTAYTNYSINCTNSSQGNM